MEIQVVVVSSRGSEGEWLGGFFKYIGINSVYIHKLWGVLEGLKLAMTMDLQYIIMEVDSQQMVNDIISEHQSNNMRSALLSLITFLIVIYLRILFPG